MIEQDVNGVVSSGAGNGKAANVAYLLAGGTLVDGSGAAGYAGDLLLQGERIVAVGAAVAAARAALPAGTAVTEIDCRGKVIAPGFIDVHTHDDTVVLNRPEMLPKLSQGVTSVIVGNCGISLSPYVVAEAPPPLNLLGKDSYIFGTMQAYADHLAEVVPGVNVGVLIGHTTLRFGAMDTLERTATDAEIAQMEATLDAALTEGALGMSSGLFYEPAFSATSDEVLALARVVGRHRGVYTSHLRSEMAAIIEAIHEAGDIAFEGGVPLVISHHKCAGPANWGRTLTTLPLIEELAKRQEIGMDVYPYVAGSTVLREDLVDGVIDVLVTWSTPHPDTAGRLLADIAEEWGVTQQEVCRRLQPGGACYFQMHDDDVDRVIQHPLTMIGSDGLPHDSRPHPRLWGTFPRVLGHYARDRGMFTLEAAIHKMTGLSAKRFRIAERGLLQPGFFADVTVFDPLTIRDNATFEDPIQLSTGITAVFVNGAPAYVGEGGPSLGELVRAGRLLRRVAAAVE